MPPQSFLHNGYSISSFNLLLFSRQIAFFPPTVITCSTGPIWEEI